MQLAFFVSIPWLSNGYKIARLPPNLGGSKVKTAGRG